MTPSVLPGALLGVLLGALVGVGIRVGLAQIRRGVRVGRGWCEAGAGGCGAVTGALAAGGGVAPAWVPVLVGLAALGVAGSATDLLTGRLPDALTLPAVPVVLALLVPVGGTAVAAGAVGVLAVGGLHVAVYLLLPGALGGGDVKLAAALGAPLGAVGAWAAPAAVGGAALLALAAAAVASRSRVPFGPPLLLSSWLVVLTGA